MSVIHVDELVIRLPSDARNTFNPSFAFGGGNGNSNRGAAPVMGLREVQSGHVLLPMDSDGSIVVTPGQRYSVVLVREMRGSAPAAATRVEDSAPKSSDGGATKAAKGAPSAKPPPAPLPAPPQRVSPRQHEPRQQPPAKEASEPRDGELEIAVGRRGLHGAQEERASARARDAVATEAERSPVSEAPRAPGAEQPSKKRKRHDEEAAQAQREAPQQRRQKTSPVADAQSEAAALDDAPLVEAFASSQSHTSSGASPVQATSTSADNSHHSSKRGSPHQKAERAVAPLPPPQPLRRSPSTSSHDEHDGAPSLAQLYGTSQPAAPDRRAERRTEEADDTATAVTSKKRRAALEKKTKPATAAVGPATTTTTGRPLSPSQPAAAKAPSKKSASPDRVPVTLPPSSRSSTVRRVPLDTSSDSD
ncbi:hypothetical protein NESM_000633300 [Novymonas esmeraldas]|uniref:Uncharacterized protein n=1 Tax=Novymonas esmeraldas TaxID=1808958 RepID=A0AAW0ES98_9TRYP